MSIQSFTSLNSHEVDCHFMASCHVYHAKPKVETRQYLDRLEPRRCHLCDTPSHNHLNYLNNY
jgi:hypothetical protein